MTLINVDSSLDIMDAIILDEKVSYTNAKKMMVRKVKVKHRDMLLETLQHQEKEYSFSSYENGDDIHGKERTKTITGKLYNKHDVMIAIEEYIQNKAIAEQFDTVLKEIEQSELLKQKEVEQKEAIELRAKELHENQNIDFDLDSLEKFLESFDNMLSYEKCYEIAKKEILGC